MSSITMTTTVVVKAFFPSEKDINPWDDTEVIVPSDGVKDACFMKRIRDVFWKTRPTNAAALIIWLVLFEAIAFAALNMHLEMGIREWKRELPLSFWVSWSWAEPDWISIHHYEPSNLVEPAPFATSISDMSLEIRSSFYNTGCEYPIQRNSWLSLVNQLTLTFISCNGTCLYSCVECMPGTWNHRKSYLYALARCNDTHKIMHKRLNNHQDETGIRSPWNEDWYL